MGVSLKRAEDKGADAAWDITAIIELRSIRAGVPNTQRAGGATVRGRAMASLSEVSVEGKTLTRTERLVARCLPSLADIIFISIFVGALLGLQGRLLGLDGDAAWNLGIGTQIPQH